MKEANNILQAAAAIAHSLATPSLKNKKKKKGKKGKLHCLKIHRGRIQCSDKAFAGAPSLTTIFLHEPIKQTVFRETQL